MSEIKEVQGDITLTNCQVIAHCCNCYKVMGAGVAKALSTRWPGIAQVDKLDKRSPGERFGSFTNYVTPEGKIIFNLYGQLDYGTDQRQVNYERLYKALELMGSVLPPGTTIALPRLGCGLAGGNWTIVKSMIQFTLSHLDVTIYSL